MSEANETKQRRGNERGYDELRDRSAQYPNPNAILSKPNGPKYFEEPGPDEKECTFRPKINPISRSMATYLKPLNTEEGINYYLERKNRNLEKLRERLEKDQLVKCGDCYESIFIPKLRPAKELEEVADRLYLATFEMQRSKQLKEEEYYKETCPFMPNMDRKARNSSKENIKGGRQPDPRVVEEENKEIVKQFLERNERDKRLRDLKLEKVVYCDKNEDLSKQPRQKSAITSIQRIDPKNPNVKHTITGIDAGRRLYNLGQEQAKQKEEKSRAKTPTHPVSMNKRTNDKYLKKLMSRRFEDIFFVLDSTRSGLLTAQNARIEALHPELLRVLKDLLFEVEDFGLSLDCGHFVRACTNLYKDVGFYERNVLLNNPITNKTEEIGTTGKIGNDADIGGFLPR